MKNSTSMKILPVQNNYLNQDYSTYFNANNYQYFDNFQPKQSLKRQVSSALLSVKNNLLNNTQQIQAQQQQYPQIQIQQQQQQIPLVEIDLQNTQPLILPTKSEPKIIRIQKKIYKRNINQKKSPILMPSRSMDNFGNLMRSITMDNTSYNNNYNNNENIIYDDKNNLALTNNNQITDLTSNEYEITSPVKKNKFISYIPINEKYFQDSSKTDIKYQNQNQNLNNNYSNNFTYSDYKKYNNEYYSTNINYNTDIIPLENDDKTNNILDTKVNTSMNNLTSNYLQTNDNNDYFSNININDNNYTEASNINNNNSSINNISKNLFNYYFENSINNNNYVQNYAINSNNPNNYTNNNNIFKIPKLTTSHSSSNIRTNSNNNLIKNNNNNNFITSQIKIKNPILSRSISSGNITNYNNKGQNYNMINTHSYNYNYNYHQNQAYKNENVPHKKIQNITIIKDPMISKSVNNIYKNDIYSFNQNQNTNNDYTNYSKQDLSSYNSNQLTQNNNSNINNNYNINFNININQDYNNPNNKSNLNNIINQNNPNNYIQIEPPQLEPASNFNLLEFIKVGIVGKGTEGVIYSVKWKKNNKKYALKKGYIKLIEVVKKRQEEINMLKEFRKKTQSDGVINIYGYLCITNKHNCYNFYEIMELAEIDWDQEIERRGQLRLYYPEYELMNIMYQIVHTFSLLQQNHITHRDIKPQNIIIVNGKYKIIDFGNARILKRDGLVIQRIRGSEMYMSPVMFKGYHSKMPRVKHNTFKSDVFSLGMCFLLAATLSYTPLNTIREIYDMNIICKVIRNYLGQRYSENVYNILVNMLQVEESSRPDFIQLENLFRKINGYV